MKARMLTLTAVLFTAMATGCVSHDSGDTAGSRASNATVEKAVPSPNAAEHNHVEGPRVPAFQVDVASLKNLGPTLPPDQFIGKPREAYRVVKEIPRTIAQLPCYCHCDEGLGHKSLYSCFEDDHASHCAVCVDEALLAYRLEKEGKLKPEQIREKIIAEYSQQ